MKKIVEIACALCCAIFLTACSVTQEVKEGVTFKGLTKFYVETPRSTMGVFDACGGSEVVDQKLIAAITEFLKARNYEPVAKKEDAQIIFSPLWNISQRDDHLHQTPNTLMQATQTIPLGGNMFKYYVTLEIQAFLPDRDSWAWRGFSPIETTPIMLTTSAIQDQVSWCLEYFPPEQYPSKVEENRIERAERKYNESNEFNNVLIEERKKQEAAQ